MTTLLHMQSIIGCNTIMNYVLNRLGVLPSYVAVHRLRKRLSHGVKSHPDGTLVDLKTHDVILINQCNMGCFLPGERSKGCTPLQCNAYYVTLIVFCRNMPV